MRVRSARCSTAAQLALEGRRLQRQQNGPHSTSAVPAARKTAARAVLLKESAWFNALPAEFLDGAYDEAEWARAVSLAL